MTSSKDCHLNSNTSMPKEFEENEFEPETFAKKTKLCSSEETTLVKEVERSPPSPFKGRQQLSRKSKPKYSLEERIYDFPFESRRSLSSKKKGNVRSRPPADSKASKTTNKNNKIGQLRQTKLNFETKNVIVKKREIETLKNVEKPVLIVDKIALTSSSEINDINSNDFKSSNLSVKEQFKVVEKMIVKKPYLILDKIVLSSKTQIDNNNNISEDCNRFKSISDDDNEVEMKSNWKANNEKTYSRKSNFCEYLKATKNDETFDQVFAKNDAKRKQNLNKINSEVFVIVSSDFNRNEPLLEEENETKWGKNSKKMNAEESNFDDSNEIDCNRLEIDLNRFEKDSSSSKNVASRSQTDFEEENFDVFSKTYRKRKPKKRKFSEKKLIINSKIDSSKINSEINLKLKIEPKMASKLKNFEIFTKSEKSKTELKSINRNSLNKIVSKRRLSLKTKKLSNRKRNYNLALKKVLKKMAHEDLEEQKIEAMEEEIIALSVPFSNDTLNVANGTKQFDDQVLSSSLKEVGIDKKQGPTVQVLHCDKYLRYIRNMEELFRRKRNLLREINERGTKINGEINSRNFQGFLKRDLFLKFSKDFSTNFFDFIFEIILICDDEKVSEKCQRDLFFVIEQFGKWFPGIDLVTRMLTNLGVVPNANCPIPDIFTSAKLDLLSSITSSLPEEVANSFISVCPSSPSSGAGASTSSSSSPKSCQYEQNLPSQNAKLIIIIELIEFCLSKSNCFNSKYIYNIILVFYWISSDSKFFERPILKKIETLCSTALESFQIENWNENLNKLSKGFTSLCSHHRNVLRLTELLPKTERGIQLQIKTSFRAIHVLRDLEEPLILQDVIQPKDVLNYLKENSLRKETDYYLLYSLVSLLNTSVSFKKLETQKDSILEIAKCLMNIYHYLKETLASTEISKVKDLIVEVRCKLFLLAHGSDIPNINSTLKSELEM